MASYTAQLVAGLPNTYHGGIVPDYIAWLSENDRPGWVLQRARPSESADGLNDEARSAVWVPSAPESILEDGI